MLEKVKANKWLVAAAIGVAAFVDFAFGLGVSETVIELLTSGGAEVAP